MNAATGTLILDGLAALLNLTLRLVEARETAAAGMARSEESDAAAAAEMNTAATALDAAVQRARGLLENTQ